MKLLKYAILGLLLLNIPAFLLIHVNDTLSSVISYASFLLLVLYYVLNERTEINTWMMLVGITFFSISSLVSQEHIIYKPYELVFYFIKYFILVVCGNELAKQTSPKTLFFFLLAGALSIGAETFLFENAMSKIGRYSGFYLNPNGAAFISILGYSLSLAIQHRPLKNLGLLAFTLMGLLTVSRTFLVLWVLATLIYVALFPRNVRILFLGVGFLFLFVAFGDDLPVKNRRIEELQAFLKGEKVNTREVNSDSRADTWSRFTEPLTDSPFFGNGFDAFSGNTSISRTGCHNTYLKIWGEGGIIPFVLFVMMYLVMLRQAWHHLRQAPYLFIMTLSLVIFLTTNHNFFDMAYILFVTLWIQAQLAVLQRQEDQKTKTNNFHLALE